MNWTDKEVQYLKSHYGRETVNDIAFTLNRSYGSVLNKAEGLGLTDPNRTGNQHRGSKVKFADLKTPVTNFENLWRALENLQSEMKATEMYQDEVTVKLDVNYPIGIAYLADLHVGAATAKYKQLRERVERLSNHDRLFVASCGDTIDNYLPTMRIGSGMFEVLIPPEAQKLLAEWILKKMNGKILAMINGCHDEFSHTMDDFDWTEYLYQKFDNCAYLGFGGFLNLEIGEQKYRIGMWHKVPRFNSYLNLTHVVKRLRETRGDFDVGVVAHNHQASIETVALPDKVRTFVRPGSFKGADRYARKMGYADTGNQVPVTVLYPDERRIVQFMDLRDAEEYLK